MIAAGYDKALHFISAFTRFAVSFYTEVHMWLDVVDLVDRFSACDIRLQMQPDTLSRAEQLYAGIQLIRPLLRQITSRVEADLSGTGVSVGQRAILEVLLAIGPATAPEITRILEVKRQLVGRELKNMAANCMVSTIDNPRRKSSLIYSLTKESRRVIEGIRSRENGRPCGVSGKRTHPSRSKPSIWFNSAIYEEFSNP